MSSVQHPEMGFSLPAQLRKARHALPTPPDSPPAPPKIVQRQASRFRLPKILMRSQPTKLRTSEATKGISPSKSCDLMEMDREMLDLSSNIACRDLHLLKQPLPLVLPIGPTSTVSDEAFPRTNPKKLRKMPKSYHDLRAYKSEGQVSAQKSKLLLTTPALLPSPLLSDSEEWQVNDACFTFRNPKDPGDTQSRPNEATYEDQNVVADYCEDVFEEDSRYAENTSGATMYREKNPPTPPLQRETTYVPTVARTPPTSNMSATLRSPRRDRSNSLSSEATWLSKSFAHEDHSTCIGQLERIKINEKRLAEKSRRCCHLVQGPIDDLPASWTGERKASYATVIKPGKANDIWVPGSSASINSQSPSRAYPGKGLEVPRTPDRKLSEVSAFSPWDSPVERRASACVKREREGQLRKVATYGNLRDASQEYTPTRKPLFPIRKSFLGPVLTISPISMTPSSSTSTLTSDWSNPDSLPQLPRKPHRISSYDQTAWSKCESLAALLDALAQSLDSTSSLPQLSSPAIIRIRAPNSLDELHIDRLRTIFPHAPSNQLSTLAALLLAQSHLASLGLPRNLNPIFMPIPTTLSHPTSPDFSTYSHLLAARSNESLHHIPTRAMATLGIQRENLPSLAKSTSLAEWERALSVQAQAVEATLHVAVQKVMLLVCGRYEEVLCRALRCLVETVEERGRW